MSRTTTPLEAHMQYEIPENERKALVREMLREAASNGHQTRAIQLLVDWHEGGKQGEEPELSGLVSWKMECAIFSDLTHIYREKLPEGVFGSQYNREFIRIKRENARKAARQAAKRELDRKVEQSALRHLLGL
jgi:hypothetical protein